MKKRLLLLMSMALLTIGSALAQRTITGLIKDDKGEAMIGASVVVKGTTTGTITDVDGKFSLNVPKDAATLVVSFTGFETKEVAIGASNVVDVTMSEGKLLEEAVITAFGIKKDRSNLGYAVSQVSSEELTTAHTTNVTNALAAKIPGVRLSGSGGSFSSSSIIIRGFTSFTGSNQPLFVVDGISIDNSGGGNALQTGVTNSSRAIDLNQEDIEAISVLKGAAATSLYGSRAANGVVLITTKTGKAKEKQSITYTMSYGQQEVNRLPDYQNTYGEGNTGVFSPISNASWGPKISGQTVPLAPNLRNYYVGLRGTNPIQASDTSTTLTAFPNNVSDMFKKGTSVQHNLSFQGGKDKFGYRLSAGYTNETGILQNNDLKRYNIGLNANSEITKKLTAGVSVNYTLNKSIRSPQGNNLANPLFRGWFLPRTYDLTGLPYQTPVGNNLYFEANDNPYWTLANNLYDDQVDRVFGNVNLRYQFNDWLSASAKTGVDNFTSSASYYDQIGSNGQAGTAANGAGGIREIRNVSRILNTTFLLTAQKKFGDVDLTFVAGNEILDQFRNNLDQIGYGVTVRNFRNLQSNTTSLAANNYEKWQYRLIGFFANVTAAYKNWGTLDVAVRNDQNSILPTKNNSYAYYSVAATINPLNIFNVKSDILTGLKIRANKGLVGSAKPDFRFSTDSYYGKPNPRDGFGPQVLFPFNGLAGFTLRNTAGNPDLKPEFTASQEVGLEFDLFNGRINFVGTLYNQKSTDIILDVPNSSASGIDFITKNAGKMHTDGKELSLTIVPVKMKDIKWSTTFNYTQFKSVVDELATGVQNIFLAGFTTPNVRLVSGDEYGQIYGNAYNRDASGKLILNAAGLPTATANVQKIGNPNPKWTLGISNSISLFGFNIGVLVDIKKGGDQYSRNLADLQRRGVVAETAAVERLNSDGTVAKPYTFDGVNAAGAVNTTAVTAEQYWGDVGKYVAAEGYIYNTDWVRIREASVGYTVPKKFLAKTPFGDLNVNLFGRNLFLKSPNYPHLDPEQNVLGINNAQGLEFNALPQTKSLGVNVRVTF
jgi:TonB-linked SusC/RagA family outer membrane protein